jgi:peptidoglycan hydrolase CwlO-like protein
MRNGEVALRFSIVLSMIGFLALVAALYETDRREKSSTTTRERDLVELHHRIQTLDSQVQSLSAQLDTSERQIRTLNSQIDQYDSRLTPIEREIQLFIGRYDARLKELEDDLRVRRLESAPAPR